MIVFPTIEHHLDCDNKWVILRSLFRVIISQNRGKSQIDNQGPHFFIFFLLSFVFPRWNISSAAGCANWCFWQYQQHFVMQNVGRLYRAQTNPLVTVSNPRPLVCGESEPVMENTKWEQQAFDSMRSRACAWSQPTAVHGEVRGRLDTPQSRSRPLQYNTSVCEIFFDLIPHISLLCMHVTLGWLRGQFNRQRAASLCIGSTLLLLLERNNCSNYFSYLVGFLDGRLGFVFLKY